MNICKAVCVAVCVAIATPATAQETLRKALYAAGFDDAIAAAGGPDLDRPLATSGGATGSNSFAAAFYFQDELLTGGSPPLHVSRFQRGGRWLNAPPYQSARLGPVDDVRFQGPYVIVQMSLSPSAGEALVLASDDLRILATVMASTCS